MGHFDFKRFSITDDNCGMRLSTDAVLLGSWVDVSHVENIVDAGCGSGVIALMMAQRTEKARIVGIDISEGACKDARFNVCASPWEDRIDIRCCDIMESFPRVESPLLIVSNPPFFIESLHSPDKSRFLARHGDNFDVDALIKIGGRLLKHPLDSLAFIAPVNRNDEIEFMLSLNRLTPYRTTVVYSKKGKSPLRKLWQVVMEPYHGESIHDTLCIRNPDNAYTDEYMELTSEFYLDK